METTLQVVAGKERGILSQNKFNEQTLGFLISVLLIYANIANELLYEWKTL